MCCYRISLFFLALVVLASCQSGQREFVFYPIDSLIEGQVEALSERHARLQKTASLGENRDSSAYTPDTTGWRKELDIFKELDVINKPVNRSSYIVEHGLSDPGSNLRITAYTDTTDQPVKYLRIFYHQSVNRPRIIEALYETEHALYSSARKMRMELQDIGGKLLLTSYSVEGGQKMMMADTLVYWVRGTIHFD